MATNNHTPCAVRTRFAPSPTGALHIGGARTALFAWAFARAHQGVFILRIEDTDRDRHSEDAVAGIIESMAWLGLDYDEGPFFQSTRTERYLEVAKQLLDQGHAYRCYCSRERLDALREDQMARGEKPRYDGHCAKLDAASQADTDAPYVLRFRTPDEGSVAFDDAVRGHIEVANSELDDFIMLRSDGTPTYNFTVVVDDWDTAITHVVRGDDHINNTPRQIHLFRALGAEAPVYAHVPSILAEDGRKLSKRRGALGVMDYEDQGILPEALLNYLVRLGWSHQDDELFDREAIIRYFNLASVQRSPAALNPEKLLWLNQHYLKTLDVQDISLRLLPRMHALGAGACEAPPLLDVVAVLRTRAKTLVALADEAMLFYREDLVWSEAGEKAKKKHMKADAAPVLRWMIKALESLASWDTASLHGVLKACVADLSLGFGRVAQPVRTAVTGGAPSPSLDATLALLGRARVMRRLKDALAGLPSDGGASSDSD